VVPAAATRRQD